MMESIKKWTEADDPNQKCQALGCPNLGVIPGKNCLAHGGNKHFEHERLATLRNYRLTQYQRRIEEFTDNDKLKSLREEIAILRLLIEERMNQLQTPTDLMLHSHALSELIMKVEKVVTSCHRLESSLGDLLDKSKLTIIIQQLITIIKTHITDPEILERIANDIGALE